MANWTRAKAVIPATPRPIALSMVSTSSILRSLWQATTNSSPTAITLMLAAVVAAGYSESVDQVPSPWLVQAGSQLAWLGESALSSVAGSGTTCSSSQNVPISSSGSAQLKR